MDTLFGGTRWIHIFVGFTGLFAFWFPVFARKGGPTHVRMGRVFEWAAYVVAGTAVLNALGRLTQAVIEGARLADNRAEFGFAIFLAYLGIVTFASVRHGVRSVRLKGDFAALRTPFHVSLAALSVLGSALVVVYALTFWSGLSIVLLALSPAGVGQGVAMWSQMTRPPSERMAWYYAHMGNMIGAGIAFHTAFLVFGSARFVPFELPGMWQIVPWIMPAAIGTVAGRVAENRYRERFREPRRRWRARRGASASA